MCRSCLHSHLARNIIFRFFSIDLCISKAPFLFSSTNNPHERVREREQLNLYLFYRFITDAHSVFTIWNNQNSRSSKSSITIKHVTLCVLLAIFHYSFNFEENRFLIISQQCKLVETDPSTFHHFRNATRESERFRLKSKETRNTNQDWASDRAKQLMRGRQLKHTFFFILYSW